MNISDIQVSDQINVRGLEYRIGRFELGPVDLAVPAGSITALIGPNGAGKTTLLDLMYGMGRPQSGEVAFARMRLPVDEVAIRERIGFVSPDLTFASWGRVGKVIDYVSGFYPDWRADEAERLLSLFGVDRKEKVAGLSFGARTKLSLIIALARDTDALLLDEPTTGLDTATRRHLFAELLSYTQSGERAVIISSHQLDELERLVDRVAILASGQLLASGSLDEVVERYEQWDVLVTGALPPLSDSSRILARSQDRVRVMVDLQSNDDKLLSMLNVASRSPMSLEDVFLGLTGDSQ